LVPKYNRKQLATVGKVRSLDEPIITLLLEDGVSRVIFKGSLGSVFLSACGVVPVSTGPPTRIAAAQQHPLRPVLAREQLHEDLVAHGDLRGIQFYKLVVVVYRKLYFYEFIKIVFLQTSITLVSRKLSTRKLYKAQ
jgi:hypothetical protein